MFKGKTKKQKIFSIMSMIAYFGCSLVLIVEAALPGDKSAIQSNTIGGNIADIINNNAGDQSILVEPTSIEITNKPNKELYVGDSYTLQTRILPEDCSYKSLTYETSDDTIISVSQDGVVKANKEGKASIICYSTNYENIRTSIEFTVKNVTETSISSFIDSLSVDESGIYTLEANKSYSIYTDFEPSNTTNKSLTYTSDAGADVLSISGGTIYALKDSLGTVYTITTVSNNNKTSVLKVKIVENMASIIPLSSIQVSQKDYTMSVGESIYFPDEFPIAFLPENATYQKYKIESSDTSIVSVSGYDITAEKEGEVTITLSSTIYPEIKAERKITVGLVPLESISSISLDYSRSAELMVGNTANVTFSGVYPTNATAITGSNKNELITYSSSDESIFTVSEAGQVKGIKEGSATLAVNFYDTKIKKSANEPSVTKTLLIKVYMPSVISDFTFTDTLSESTSENKVIYTNKTYDLSSFFKIEKMYDFDNNEVDFKKQGIDTTLTFEACTTIATLDNSSLISGTKFYANTNEAGTVTFDIIHKASGIRKRVTYYLINGLELGTEGSNSNKFEANSNSSTGSFNGVDYPVLDESLSLYVSDSATISFQESPSQRYAFEFESGYENYISISSTTSNSVSIRGKDEGDIMLLVTPIYNNIEFKVSSKILYIHVHHKTISDFSIQLFNNINNSEITLADHIDENNDIDLTVDVDSVIALKLSYTPFNNPTKYELDISSSDSDISHYKNGTITFNKIGKVIYTIKEKYSGISHTITFNIVNRINLDSTNPFTIEQSKLKYDNVTSSYHIENGTPAKIATNFTKDSTYTSVSYTSSDESILKVGNDGNITPLKSGEADITATINDNNTINASYKVHIVVDKKSLISNMNSFLLLIRKGLGHFGAFLITAIFSTLFYYLAFDKKYLPLTMTFNIVQGFALAEFTEFIQLFTPGRSGLFSDVIIDFTGFSVGFGIVLLFLIVIYFIRRIKKIKKAK